MVELGFSSAAIDAVVIGGSAGSFSVLRDLVRALPVHTTVPMLIVMHLPPEPRSPFAELLAEDSPIPVKEAEDKERIAPGTIYIAPPNYHLLVEKDHCLALAADEPVNFSRPSIDVLFESAAEAFGERLLAVVLSGASVDGAKGVRAVAGRRGRVIAQAPESSEHAVMPSAAIAACPTCTALAPNALAKLFSSFDVAEEER